MNTLQEKVRNDAQALRDKLREDVCAYIVEKLPLMSHAVTLTFNGSKLSACRSKATNVQSSYDITLPQRSFKHFMNRLNAICYGNAARRHGKAVYVLPVLEGLSKSSNPHYHCAMSCPAHLNDQEFASAITEAWKQVGFGGYMTDVKRILSNEWAGYMSKQAVFIDRPNIDWDNVRLPRTDAHC